MDIANNGWVQNSVFALISAILGASCVRRFFGWLRKKVALWYSRELRSSDFVDFSNEVLLLYYADIRQDFVTFEDVRLPVATILAAENVPYPFDSLCIPYSQTELIGQSGRRCYGCSWRGLVYRYLVGNGIRRGWLQGFMLDKAHVDGAGRVIGVSCRDGTYSDNVYSSHILEFEMFMAYRRWRGRTNGVARACRAMPLRNAIQVACGSAGAVQNGEGRASLLGVQMLVAARDKSGGYSLLRITRSSSVAASCGLHQFVPSGGFEVFDKIEQSEGESLDAEELKRHYSIRNAVFREYAEELFGRCDFELGDGEDPCRKVDEDADVKHLVGLLREGKAKMVYLGNVIGLMSLRQELSFVLIIDDVQYLNSSAFKTNEEGRGHVHKIPFAEVESGANPIDSRRALEKWCADSVGLWHLLKRSKWYQFLRDGESLARAEEDKTPRNEKRIAS